MQRQQVRRMQPLVAQIKKKGLVHQTLWVVYCEGLMEGGPIPFESKMKAQAFINKNMGLGHYEGPIKYTRKK